MEINNAYFWSLGLRLTSGIDMVVDSKPIEVVA